MPDRAERRRQQRAARRQPVIIAGTGIAAAELTGHRYEARAHADLRPKTPGGHRWVASAVWVLGDDQAGALGDVDTLKYLDHENMMMLALWCWDCEQPWSETLAGDACPA